MAPFRNSTATLPARRQRRRNWKRQSATATITTSNATSSEPSINAETTTTTSTAHQTAVLPVLDRATLIEDGRPHLWLTEDNLELRFGELLESVRGRRHLSEISIYNILSRFSRQEMNHLYDTIAQFPQLQSFTVWSSQCLAVPVLTNVLAKAPRLQAMTLSNLHIHGAQEVAHLAQAIGQHPSLTKLSLDNVRMVFSTGAACTLDPLLHAIARKPQMEHLRISASDDIDAIGTATANQKITASPDALAALCRHSHLKELSLWNMELTDEAFQSMASALAVSANSNNNNSSTGSSHLERLSLRHCGPKVTRKGCASMVQMLQHNFHLQKVHLDTDKVAAGREGEDLQWKMDFLCYLNKCGTRKALHQHEANHAKPSIWVEALARHNDELNSLWYLLGECGGSNMLLSSSQHV